MLGTPSLNHDLTGIKFVFLTVPVTQQKVGEFL